ncbi:MULTISPECIES: hypothetical protein [Lactobacillales]|uniref:hypothetical protein n=1 Tax=Lactobacillales TaxID=186826 RepID=UPI00026C869A|nr:hypothetical protein [Carnobacterium maltaromaticum]
MTESTSEYKKRIEEIKQSIENEPYMAKMREDIAEGISKTGIRQATVEEQFQSVLDETTGKDVISAPEIILARGGAQTLGERLDSEKAEVRAELAQTAKKTEARLKSENISINDLGQDVKEAMTGGSVAVVGKNAIDSINVRKNAIKEENTVFVERVTVNLFNPKTINYGFALHQGLGTLVANSDYKTTDYITIKGSTAYRVDSDSPVGVIVFYDIDFNFISSISDVHVTSPQNARYLRKTVSSSFDMSSFRIYEQPLTEPAQRPYVPYKIKVSNLVEKADLLKLKVIGKNHFDKTGSNLNTIIDRDGVILTGNNWSTSDFLMVEPSTEFTLSNPRFILEFDENLLPVIGTFRDIAVGTASHTFTTNTQTKYVRVTYRTTDEETMQLEKGTVITGYEEIKYGLFHGNNEVSMLSEDLKEDRPLVVTSGYTLADDNQDFQVYLNNNTNDKVMAVFRNIAVKLNTSSQAISISTTGINGSYDKAVLLTSSYFPNLLSGSFVNNIYILPWSRNSGGIITGTEWRMVIITNKGQIYHNFPKRALNNDGVALDGDEIRFEESVVWDLEERKFPTKSKTPSDKEYYFPVLPDENYNHYPKLNSDPTFNDTYGNGGFSLTKTDSEKVFSRFYRNGLDVDRNSFVTFGGFDYSDNLAMLGTYRHNLGEGKGVRTGVFVSDDGGRQWHFKYEFSDDAGGVSNWGSSIKLTNIEGEYTPNSFSIQNKTNNIPTNAVKEPENKFRLGQKIKVSSISKGNPAIVMTSTPHELSDGNTVVFHKNDDESSVFDFMTNNELTTDSHGNGIFFKVKALTSTTFELYEYVHSWSNNIPCQHIHGINRVKDGFTMCTGETHPMGWIFYIPVHSADNYGFVKASSDIEFVRLNSSEIGMQRAIGVLLPDDNSNDIIVASDTTTSPRDEISLAEGRTETISRSTVGVFRGKIEDIDDFSKFTCILEVDEPSYYFKEHNGVYYHFGQRGELGVSFDKGSTWITKQFSGSNFYKMGGFNNDFVVIGEAIIALK